MATFSSSAVTPSSRNKKRKRERLDKNSRIAIIGSGLGGLGAAISLELAGFTNILVLERDASFGARREGYGLTLSYNPKGPLAHMGLLEQVAQQDCPSRSHYMFQAPTGKIVGYFGNAFNNNNSGMGQRGNLRIPRQALRRIMLDKVQAPIVFGKQLVSFAQEEEENSSTQQLTLQFADGSSESGVDLLIGADGIRSAVLQQLVPNSAGLNYLGIFIILGIAEFCHPLLDECGFYSLDGTHRLFTMPYAGTKLDGKNRRIMWQLSYRLENNDNEDDEAQRLSAAGPLALQQEVLRRCREWHDPVVDMVQSTPLETIWGTGLYDRDPKQLPQLDPSARSRVVVLGDAVHSMSPFKGAGANQALLDGPLLVDWLQRASLESALRGFWREMTTRTSSRVLASRQAAAYLHSPQVLLNGNDFAGIAKERLPALLSKLEQLNVGADNNNNGAELDECVRQVIQEHGFQEQRPAMIDNNNDDNEDADDAPNQEKALVLASRGDIQGLRNLSLVANSKSVRAARDEKGRTCLHLAAQAGHYHACRWLLTEAFLSADTKDLDGKTPSSEDERITTMFQQQL